MGLYNTFGVTVTKRWPLIMARGVISKLEEMFQSTPIISTS